jgi:hypothetical protein
MYKNTTKCNKTQSKWCVNKHGASKIIDTFETYHPAAYFWFPLTPLSLTHLVSLFPIILHRESTLPSSLEGCRHTKHYGRLFSSSQEAIRIVDHSISLPLPRYPSSSTSPSPETTGAPSPSTPKPPAARSTMSGDLTETLGEGSDPGRQI